MRKNVKLFKDFINEQDEQATPAPTPAPAENTEAEKKPEHATPESNAPLRGYTAEQIIGRIEEIMEIMPDDMRFGVPSDTYGHATTYRDANGAIEKIRDMQHYYESKGEEVRFYCWNINYSGSWEATKNLRKKIEEAGGFGKYSQNMNLKKVIAYFSSNKEDVDNVRSIAISMDSNTIREFAKRMANKQEGSLD